MPATLSKKRRRALLIFILPGLILLGVFMILPFFLSFGLSFTDQRLISRLPTRFVGFRNYVRLFDDDLFLTSLKNNFVFAGVVVPVQTFLALCMALIVNQKLKGVKFFRTSYFMPTVTAMVVVSVVWSFLYNPDGLINKFFEVITFGNWETVDFLNNPKWAFPCIMFMSIWQGAGFQMLIFLAGLQEIPENLYEAATIDGATTFQKFWNITLPQLKNTTTFVLIATTILALRVFSQVKVMTEGGPRNSTYTVVLHLYNEGFMNQKVGYASAMTVIFFLIVLGLSLAQRWILSEEREV